MKKITKKTLKCLNYLTAMTISNAKSGHTGTALGASSIVFALYNEHLHFDKTGTNWINRDRFVLSCGHASALLYSTLHLFGYDISLEDLKQFRNFNKKTPGHPEVNNVPGVETSTGPLGQGVANAVGMAIGEARMEALFPEHINNYTYCLCGDGCLMEGVAMEACSIAGTLGLKRLILLYDNNDVTIDGTRQDSNAENIENKFKSMNWNVIKVKNGNNYAACSKAIKNAKLSKKPSIIIFKTTIGLGTKYQGLPKIHAYPLPENELEEYKSYLKITGEFKIDNDVYNYCRETTHKNDELIKLWNENLPDKNMFDSLINYPSVNYNNLYKELCENDKMSGRDASSFVLNSIANKTSLFGGAADVAESTKAFIKNSNFFNANDELKQFSNNIHYGVREHAMGAISNGIALYSPKLNVFESTFTAFSNYMTPALRMRALMDIPVISFFTHDSIDIGQDGPTHQPIEQIPQMRLIPNLFVFRPSCYGEIVGSYKYFFKTHKPTVLTLSKNNIQNIENAEPDKTLKGGYVIYQSKKTEPDIEIIASGREIYLALEVAKKFKTKCVSIVSMPCEKLFETQSESYKKSVLKSPKLRVIIEATNDNVWYKYLSEKDLLINIDSYQQSGNGEVVYEKAGFNVENIYKRIKSKLK